MQWAFLILAIWAVLILLSISRSFDRFIYLLERMSLARVGHALFYLSATVCGNKRLQEFFSKIHEEDQIDSSNS